MGCGGSKDAPQFSGQNPMPVKPQSVSAKQENPENRRVSNQSETQPIENPSDKSNERVKTPNQDNKQVQKRENTSEAELLKMEKEVEESTLGEQSVEIRSVQEEKQTAAVPVEFPCLRASCKSKWPIHTYGVFNEGRLNVNAKYGGEAVIIYEACSYGGEGTDTTCEVFFMRLGFDGNHMSRFSVGKCNHGHFGAENTFVTDEEGNLYPDCMFGTNHISVISNNPAHGDNSHGVVIKGSDDGETPSDLPINVNGGDGAGATLVLASGFISGSGDAQFVNGFYVLRSGHKGDHVQSKHLHGDDKWIFVAKKGGLLTATGPRKSQYAIFHNRDNLNYDNRRIKSEGRAKHSHAQSVNGSDQTNLLFNVNGSCAVLVLCSHGAEPEDSTAAALYVLALNGEELKKSMVKELQGKTCTLDNTDLWDFQIENGTLSVTGPEGPCRYAALCNLPGTDGDSSLVTAMGCLGTGEGVPAKGTLTVTKDGLSGVVSKASDVVITMNGAQVDRFSANQLSATPGNHAFNRKWTTEEKKPGLYLVRAFMERKTTTDGTFRRIELDGSPYQLIHQPPGVVYALNCAGPAYQALNDIVYTSEFGQFSNFDKNYVFGTRYKCLGCIKSHANIPHILCNTLDGFLHVSCRLGAAEAVDEQKIVYKFENLPDGKFTMRINSCSPKYGSCKINGVDVTREVNKQFKQTNEILPGCTAMSASIPVTVSGGVIDTYMKDSFVAGIAILDKTYKDKERTAEEKKADLKEKQQLTDKLEPLIRTMFRKQRKTIGWSQNLLKNSSAEAGDMSYWNYSGDYKVQEGGYGTEKCFATSHMWCVKAQEVDLTEHFSQAYLDTAPDIEVSEWYREGVGGGGFYRFNVTIMDAHGKVIDRYKSGEIGRIYRNNKWEQEKKMFSNYGPGVRRVSLESAGKDDKYWGGHYGALMSNAIIKVKREALAADEDSFADVIQDGEAEAASRSSKRDKLVAHIIANNESLVKEMIDDNVIPDVDPSFTKHLESNIPATVKRRKKKREIRVFVSSTFRDFKEEREELIKKTFREINALCAERGVFFTYVDLRWGITEEQTNTGKTVAICLQEIARCSPYFICMLGERFGWSQQTEEEPDELLNQSFDYAIKQDPKSLGWVEKYRYGTSVTKLEILHGVLNDVPNRKDRSFFYLRDGVDPDQIEDPKLLKAMQPESDWHKEKQYELRESVNNLKGTLNVREFKAAKEVCELIKKDLQWCVDQDFPSGTELTMLEREREAHEAFADARRRVYIGREEYFTQINEFMEGAHHQPLVILGESGSGKSALVANWAGRVEEQHPDAFIFVHFIGSSAESASYIKLLRRLYEEIKRHFSFSLSIPATDANLIRDLPVWLKMAGTFGKCFLVFDALNQLDDGSGEEGNDHDLLWIPKELPPGVSMLLSTLPGRAYEAVKSFSWPEMQVKPLAVTEKMDIVIGYMEGIYGKTLADDQKQMIVDAEQTNNPLYLKALLDEVRVYGNFRTLTAKIQEYLSAPNPGDLFAKILERLEQDFECGDQPRPGLVRQTTSAIWCSHKGMSEAELLELLQVPSAIWSPFYLSLIENLVNRNGILNFFHDHLRQAVEGRYLPTPDDKTKGYLELANFFSQQPIEDRVVDELPWLLARAGELDRLKDTISQLEVFKRLQKSEEGKFDLIKSWTLLGDFNQVEAAYQSELSKVPVDQRNTDEQAELRQRLAEFYISLGLYDAARSMLESLLVSLEVRYQDSDSTIVYNPFNQSRQSKCNHHAVIDLLLTLGTVCEKQKNFDKAQVYYDDVIYRQNRVITPAQKLKLCESLLGQASVLYSMDNMIDAKKYLVRARQLGTEVLGPRHHYVAAIINKLGQLSYKQGRLDEALGYFIQDLYLTRSDVGTAHPRVGSILNDIALAYDDKSDPIAGQLYESALAIFLDTYGSSHLDVALNRYNLGSFYFATNYFSRAKYQFNESLKVYEAFLGKDHSDTHLTRQALEEVSAFVR